MSVSLVGLGGGDSGNIIDCSNFLNSRPEFRYKDYNYGLKTTSVDLSKIPRISEEVKKLVKEYLMTPLGHTAYVDWSCGEYRKLEQIPLLANFSLQQSELTQKEDRIQQCIANVGQQGKRERMTDAIVPAVVLGILLISTDITIVTAFLANGVPLGLCFLALLGGAAITTLLPLALGYGIYRVETFMASRKLSRALWDHDDFIKQCNETNARELGRSVEFYRSHLCERMLRFINSQTNFLRATLDPHDDLYPSEMVRAVHGTAEQRLEKLNKLLVIKAELLRVREFYSKLGEGVAEDDAPVATVAEIFQKASAPMAYAQNE